MTIKAGPLLFQNIEVSTFGLNCTASSDFKRVGFSENLNLLTESVTYTLNLPGPEISSLSS